MRSSCASLLTLLIAIVLAAPAIAADAEPLPSSDELHKLFDDGQYKQVLAKLPRVLVLKGPAATGYDMVDLHILKADTFIQLKQQKQANDALADALKAATPLTDPKVTAKARALQIALKHSTGLVYKPKKGANTINLQDMASRPALYTALLGDMQAEVGERIKTAQSSKALPPIITAIQGLADMGAVEMIATGNDTASQKAADDLANSARQLMSDSVKTMSERVGTIDKDANRLQELPARDVPITRGGDPNKRQTVPERRFRKTGLTSASRDVLRDTIDTCHKIQDACVDFETVSKVHAGGFKSVADSASRLAEDANTTLTADYLTETTQR